MSETSRAGIFVGGQHDHLEDIPVVLKDSNTHLRIEGGELNLPLWIQKDKTIHTFTGKNYEILEKILKIYGYAITDKVTDVRAGDIVICIRSAWDDEIRTYTGTIIQILSAINESCGCKHVASGATMTEHSTGETFQMKKGGKADLKFDDSRPLLSPSYKISPAPMELLKKPIGKNIQLVGLAPNMQPSNLNEVQWKLVRTPEFKKWFGDWENDPKNSSKVIDENGEPLVVYHGTQSRFNVFNISELGGNYYGSGIYFANFEQAKKYSEYARDIKYKKKRIIEVFLSIKKLFILNNEIEIKKLVDRYADTNNSSEEDLEQFAKYTIGYRSENPNLFQKNIKEDGYDGLLVDDGMYKTYIAYYPTQIKLADGTNTAFNPNNPDIRKGTGGILDLPLENIEYDYNKKGGLNYYGEARKVADRCAMITLPEKIEGTNCGNCIFFKDNFCDHKEILLPVNSRMCCTYWNDKSIGSIIENLPKANFFPDKTHNFPLNEEGGYEYSGEALERAKNADVITLPPKIIGTTCAEGNCMYGKNNFCIHPKIQLPVTDRMTCGWWDNELVKRPWGKPEEKDFSPEMREGGKLPKELSGKREIGNVGFGGTRQHTIGEVNLEDLKVLPVGLETAKKTFETDKSFKPTKDPIIVGVDIHTGEKQLLDGYHRYVSKDGKGKMKAKFVPMENDTVIKFETLNFNTEKKEGGKNTRDIYIYHGTGKGQALNIQRDGFMKLNPTGEEKASISFTKDLDYAKYYAKSKGGSDRMVILRTQLDDTFKLSPRIKNNKGAEYVTLKNVPSSSLELMTNNGWQPLDKWNVIFNEPLQKINPDILKSEGGIIKSLWRKVKQLGRDIKSDFEHLKEMRKGLDEDLQNLKEEYDAGRITKEEYDMYSSLVKSLQFKEGGKIADGYIITSYDYLKKTLGIPSHENKEEKIGWYMMLDQNNIGAVWTESPKSLRKIKKEPYHKWFIWWANADSEKNLKNTLKLQVRDTDAAKQKEKDKAISDQRWVKKREHIQEISNNIRKLKVNVARDLKSEDEKEFLTALVITVMLNTAERVGNSDSADNGHFGVTGFQKKHLSVRGDTVCLTYTGKSGVKHDKSFSDEKIARALKKAAKNSAGKFVFQTTDGFCIKCDKVNRYLSEYNITAKDIRGYLANKLIIQRLEKELPKLDKQELDLIKLQKERKKIFNKAVKETAGDVGHGGSTLKKHYMVPELQDEFVLKGNIVDLNNLGYYKEAGVVAENPSAGLTAEQMKKVPNMSGIGTYFMNPFVIPDEVNKQIEHLKVIADATQISIEELRKTYPLQDISFEDIIPMQEEMNADKTEDYVNKVTSQDFPPVFVIECNGKYYLNDGHHRVIAWHLNEMPIKAYVYKIETESKTNYMENKAIGGTANILERPININFSKGTFSEKGLTDFQIKFLKEVEKNWLEGKPEKSKIEWMKPYAKTPQATEALEALNYWESLPHPLDKKSAFEATYLSDYLIGGGEFNLSMNVEGNYDSMKVTPTPKLKKLIDTTTLVYPFTPKDFYFQITESGALYLNYQKIIGSKMIAQNVIIDYKEGGGLNHGGSAKEEGSAEAVNWDKWTYFVNQPDYKGTIKRSVKGWLLYTEKDQREEAGEFNSLESLMDYYDIKQHEIIRKIPFDNGGSAMHHGGAAPQVIACSCFSEYLEQHHPDLNNRMLEEDMTPALQEEVNNAMEMYNGGKMNAGGKITGGEWNTVLEEYGYMIYADKQLIAEVLDKETDDPEMYSKAAFPSLSEAKANAHLMAASKEIYETLKDIDEYFRATFIQINTPKMIEIKARIKKNIQKAEGKK